MLRRTEAHEDSIKDIRELADRHSVARERAQEHGGSASVLKAREGLTLDLIACVVSKRMKRKAVTSTQTAGNYVRTPKLKRLALELISKKVPHELTGRCLPLPSTQTVRLSI